MKTFYHFAVITLAGIAGITEAAVCRNTAIAPGYCCSSDYLTIAQPYSAQGVYLSSNCTQASNSASFSCSGSQALARCAFKVVGQ